MPTHFGAKFWTASFAVCLWVAALAPASAQPVTYVSPFQISLSANIGAWTSDIAARNTTVNTNDGTWYTTPPTVLGYGPTNVQLFSTATPITPANQAVENIIQFDRGLAYDTSVAINSPPPGVDPTTFDEQRLLYVASTLIGTPYQHIHLPTFDPWTNGYTVAPGPPPNWPWAPVSNAVQNFTTQGALVNNIYQAQYGTGTSGIDCTDFAAYLYNVALGIQMPSGTSTQITFSTNNQPSPGNTPSSAVLAADGAVINPNFLESPNYGTGNINLPGSLDSVISQLHPGDLLYISGNPGASISHVVVWLGIYGTNVGGGSTGVPLVISSHDNTPSIFDVWGSNIDPVTGLPIDPNTGLPIDPTDNAAIAQYLPPPGVEILPFTDNTWFYQNFAVASQILPAPVPEPALTALGLSLAAFVGAGFWRRK